MNKIDKCSSELPDTSFTDCSSSDSDLEKNVSKELDAKCVSSEFKPIREFAEASLKTIGVAQAKVSKVTQAIVNSQKDINSKSSEILNNQAKRNEEKRRINGIIVEVTKRGEFLSDKRPEGVSPEDWKKCLYELKRVRKNYLRGKIIHNSKPDGVKESGSTFINKDKK